MNKLIHSSTATNAACSPFLALPAELRRRIYDFVFGSNTIRIIPCRHMEHEPNRIGYALLRCTCEQDLTQLSPRIRGYEYEGGYGRVCTQVCQYRTASHAEWKKGLSLASLQVCRQIYHEAVLKPFQKSFFTFGFGTVSTNGEGLGLQAFMNALVPTQAKAITRLRLLSPSSTLLCCAKLAKLESLRHLDLQLNLNFSASDDILQRLERFANDPLVRSLVKLNLKTIRLDLGLNKATPRQRHLAALLGQTSKSPLTANNVETFEELLKLTETGVILPVS